MERKSNCLLSPTSSLPLFFIFFLITVTILFKPQPMFNFSLCFIFSDNFRECFMGFIKCY